METQYIFLQQNKIILKNTWKSCPNQNYASLIKIYVCNFEFTPNHKENLNKIKKN